MLPQGLNVIDSTRKEAGQVRTFLQRHEELKQIRAPFDAERKLVCQYVFPRRSFVLPEERVTSVRPRYLVDSTAAIAHERSSATLFGYLLSPHSPFIRPELLERDFTYAEDSWADEVARRMHRYLSGSATNFRSHMAEDIDDITAFGDSVLWQQPTSRGSIWLSVPNAQMCWAENELGVIDEHYRQFPMSLRRAALRWPDAVKLQERAAKSHRPESETVQILHIVEPRAGGVAGDLREVKPQRDILIYIDGMEVLEIGGHDRKPLNVGRFKRRPGDSYGWGPGWTMMPLSKLANAILAAWAHLAEQNANPTLISMLPATQALDRRPGAVNHVNALLAMGLRDPKSAIQRIETGGDIGLGADLLRLIWNKIEQAAYIDWMTPREGPQQTATEVLDRRDIRLRSLGPIVAKIENEKMSVLADNTYQDMMAARLLPRPPASLNGLFIAFDYKGPLALAQQQGAVEGFQRYLALAQQVVAVTGDPAAARMLKPEETLRSSANAYGVEGRYLASPEEMRAFREGQRQIGEMKEELQAAESAARALQAGGQGIANLAQVTGAAA